MTDTPVVIQTPRFSIEGKSRAGNETYFRVRELGVSLDIGRCPDLLISVPHIFAPTPIWTMHWESRFMPRSDGCADFPPERSTSPARPWSTTML